MKKILLISLILIGCATPKQNQRKAVKHYEKAVKFGLVINPTEPPKPDAFITDTIVDSKGNVFLTKRAIFYNCPACNDIVYPKSKTEIRNETKQQKNELKFNYKMYSDSLKHSLKLEKQRTEQLEDSLRFNKRKYGTELRQLNKQFKQEEKTERKWAKWINGLMVGLAIGIISAILVCWWIGACRRRKKNPSVEQEIEALRSVLNEIVTAPEPYNEMEAFSFVQTARSIANKAINLK
jgi:hypothetical protein